MDKIKEINKYFQPPIGNTEKLVSVLPVEQIETVIDTNNFIKSYKLSRFGNSYFSIKRLIYTIFKKKLKCPIDWNNSFWSDTKIILLKCKINVINNESSINLIKSLKAEPLNGTLNNKRIKDINKYAKKINQGMDLGNPLYISGDVLNMIGGSINPYEMYMIDGSRRLIANALCKQKFIKIWLIVIK